MQRTLKWLALAQIKGTKWQDPAPIHLISSTQFCDARVAEVILFGTGPIDVNRKKQFHYKNIAKSNCTNKSILEEEVIQTEPYLTTQTDNH